jgi:hypothetical protein
MAQQQQQPLRFDDILTLDGLKVVVDWLRMRGVVSTDEVPADLLEVFIGCFASLHALQHAKVYIFCNFARGIGDMADSGAYPTAGMKKWLVSAATGAIPFA